MISYLCHVAVTWAILASVALPLALFGARTGYLSIMQAIFFSVGAYAIVLAERHSISAPLAWLGAALMGGAIGYLLTFPIFRTKAVYFVVLTIALQTAGTLTLVNAESITNGTFGLPVRDRWPFGAGPLVDAAASIIFLGVFYVATEIAARSRTARMLDASRQNETLMTVLGYDVAAQRSRAFLMLAVANAVSGALFAKYLAFIDPTSFQLTESIAFLSIVVISGTGRAGAVLLAAALIVSLPEALRFLPLGGASLANLQQVLYGLALVGAVFFLASRTRHNLP